MPIKAIVQPRRRALPDGGVAEEITKQKPEKSLVTARSAPRAEQPGRNHELVAGRGRRRPYRIVDFKRNKSGYRPRCGIEYDPNRSARLALLNYADARSATFCIRRAWKWGAW